MAAGTSTHLNNQAALALVNLAATLCSLMKAVLKIFVKGLQMSTQSLIHPDLVECYSLIVHYSLGAIFMSSTSTCVQTSGFCLVDLRNDGWQYV